MYRFLLTPTMSILNFFSEADDRYPGMKLPHPSGLLARKVPASAITAANDQVNRVLSQQNSSKTRATQGTYQKLSAEKEAETGEKAAECGVSATLWFYSSKLPEPLKESSVWDWRNTYLREVKRLKAKGKMLQMSKSFH